MNFEGALKLIILIGAACTALIGICALVIKVFKLVEIVVNMHKNDKRRTEESRILIETQLACLEGLTQIGANGPVTKAKANLEQYIVEHYGGD